MRKRWPKARIVAVDLALPMLREAGKRSGWWRPFDRVQRRRARPALRRRQRGRAVLESVPAVGRGSAGGVRGIPPRAEARRPAARLHLRPGDAAGIARCLLARRCHAARFAVRHRSRSSAMRSCMRASRTRCSIAICTPRAMPTWPSLMREQRAIGATNALQQPPPHADRPCALRRRRAGLRRLPPGRRHAARHVGSHHLDGLGAAARRADP